MAADVRVDGDGEDEGIVFAVEVVEVVLRGMSALGEKQTVPLYKLDNTVFSLAQLLHGKGAMTCNLEP